MSILLLPASLAAMTVPATATPVQVGELPPAESQTAESETAIPLQGEPQSVEEAEAELELEDDIIVTGSRQPRGSVIGDIKPEVVLSGRDIRAYGASNIGELLEELAPLTGSIQGRGAGAPVVLLGGRRISDRDSRDTFGRRTQGVKRFFLA